MAWLRKFGVLGMCLWLAACGPGPMAGAYRPVNADFAKDMPASFVLKNKVTLKEVSSGLKNNDLVTVKDFSPALKGVLSSAHVLVSDKNKADYALSARIMDYRVPATGLTEVTCGAAVAYRLVETGTGRLVMSKTVTNSYVQAKGLLDDAQAAMQTACGTAFAENAVQLARELAAFRPRPVDPGEMPLRRLEGAR